MGQCLIHWYTVQDTRWSFYLFLLWVKYSASRTLASYCFSFNLTCLWFVKAAPVYLSERRMHPSSTFVMNNPTIETNVYMHNQKQMSAVEEFPERPGEPECSYFLKTGDCKFKSNCKFHHPKNRIARLPPCNLSDKGLPLRPVS